MNLFKSIRPPHFGLIVLIALNLAKVAVASELPEHFLPVRALGMGGAYTAVANDEHSAWTNPAGIARIRKPRSRQQFHSFRAPNLTMGANSQSQNFISGFQGTQSSVSDFIANSQFEAVSEDSPLWMGASSFPNMIIEAGGLPVLVGAYNYSRGRVFIDRAVPESATIEAVSDLGAVATTAFSSTSNRFNAGLSLRAMARYAYEDVLASDRLTDRSYLAQRLQQGANRSIGIAMDAGVMMTLADFWYPTVAASVLNLPIGCRPDYLNPFTRQRETVCGTTFSGTFANEDALSTVDPMDMRVGVSITPRLGRQVSLRLAGDIHHLPISLGGKQYGLTSSHFMQHLHAGAELFWGNPLENSDFSLRIGAHQGYFTAGATMIAGPVLLEFASYGVDVTSSNRAAEDRRFVGTVTMLF